MEITDKLFVQLGNAACAFANLTEINSAADVERHFPWITKTMKSDSNAAAIYTAEQQQLRRLLDAMMTLDGDSTRADEFRRACLRPVVLENPARPAKHFLQAELVFTDRGFEAGDLPAAATFGVKTGWLLFMDSALTERRLKRVRKCGWRPCPAPYFLQLDERGRLVFEGRPRKAHDEHKAKFDKQRARDRKEEEA